MRFLSFFLSPSLSFIFIFKRIIFKQIIKVLKSSLIILWLILEDGEDFSMVRFWLNSVKTIVFITYRW